MYETTNELRKQLLLPEVDMIKKHLYCTGCGLLLIEKFKLEKYDQATGEKQYTKHMTCPNRRFYNSFLHDQYEVMGGGFGTSKLYFKEREFRNKEI